MLTLIIAIAFVYLLVKLFRRLNNYDSTREGNFHNSNFGGAGNMMSGMILGYLLSRYLISPNQYDMWRDMNADELRTTLVENGVVSDDEFIDLQNQAVNGELPEDANDVSGDNAVYDSYNDDSADSFDNYDDAGSGGDDFGGFDL